MASDCPFVQLWNSVFGTPKVSWTPPGRCVVPAYSIGHCNAVQICRWHGQSQQVREGGGRCALRDGSQCFLGSPGQGLNESSLLPALYCLNARSSLKGQGCYQNLRIGSPQWQAWVACSLVECLSRVWEAWVPSPAL